MRTVVYKTYGAPEVLHLQEAPMPTPKDNEIRVRVHAASINYGDLIARNFSAVSPSAFNMPLLFWFLARLSFGFRKPRLSVLGNEFAGVVDAVGKDVTRFKTGERVFGYLGQNMGAYADYLCITESGCVALMPRSLSFQEAATVPYGAMMALALLHRAAVQPGQKVLIHGASGAIGSAAVQLAAHHFGAEVTGVCSTPGMARVQALGAAKVIDYTKEDFSQQGERYDLIFDVLGKASFSRCRDALTPEGIHLCASFKTQKLLQMLRTARGRGQRLICAIAPGAPEDLFAVKKLVEEGKLKAIIDRCFPLENAAEAHRYAETGRKTGSVVITTGAPERANLEAS